MLASRTDVVFGGKKISFTFDVCKSAMASMVPCSAQLSTSSATWRPFQRYFELYSWCHSKTVLMSSKFSCSSDIQCPILPPFLSECTRALGPPSNAKRVKFRPVRVAACQTRYARFVLEVRTYCTIVNRQLNGQKKLFSPLHCLFPIVQSGESMYCRPN